MMGSQQQGETVQQGQGAITSRLSASAISRFMTKFSCSSTHTVGAQKESARMWRREILVGTESGALHVLRLDEKEKRERLWAPLLQLDGADGSAVRGCHQQV